MFLHCKLDLIELSVHEKYDHITKRFSAKWFQKVLSDIIFQFQVFITNLIVSLLFCIL